MPISVCKKISSVFCGNKHNIIFEILSLGEEFLSLGLELVVSMQVRIPAYWTLIQECLDLGSGPRFLDVNVGKMKLDFRPIIIIVESPWGLGFRLEGHSSPVENRISSASSHIFSLYT